MVHAQYTVASTVRSTETSTSRPPRRSHPAMTSAGLAVSITAW